MRRFLLAGLLSFLSWPALAANCPSLPFTLTNNTVADANQVMANFNSLLNCANTTLAPIASPTFTGTPSAPTPTAGAAPSQIATVGYVQGSVVLGANPTATAGSVAINGGATTYMRSDAAPAVQTATASVLGLVRPDNVTIGVTSGVIGTAAISVAGVSCANGGSCSLAASNLSNGTTGSGNIVLASGGRLTLPFFDLNPSTPGNAAVCVLTSSGSTGFAGTCGVSDARLKTDWQSDVPGLDFLMGLHPGTFSWLDVTEKKAGRQAGLAAQDVEKGFPGAVTTGGNQDITLADGTHKTIDAVKTLDYGKLTLPLIVAAQQQQRHIQTLILVVVILGVGLLALAWVVYRRPKWLGVALLVLGLPAVAGAQGVPGQTWTNAVLLTSAAITPVRNADIFPIIQNGLTRQIDFATLAGAIAVAPGGVLGPPVSTPGHIAVWNNGTGSLLADGGVALGPVTIGTTTIPLGGTSTTLAGLLKVSGNGGVTGATTVPNYGLGFQASPSFSAPAIYNMAVCATFPCTPLLNNYDGVQGAVAALPGSNMTNVTGVAGYAYSEVDHWTAPSGPGANVVALFGSASAAHNDAHIWGINTVVTDNHSQQTLTTFTGNLLQGYEADFNVTSSNTQVFGITVEGVSLANPALANGISVGCLALVGTACNPVVAHWTTAFLTANGCCSNSLSIGTLAGDGTGQAQPILFFNSGGSNSLVVSGGVYNFNGGTPTLGLTNMAITVHNTAGTSLQGVTLGSPDSGGTGFRALRVAN